MHLTYRFFSDSLGQSFPPTLYQIDQDAGIWTLGTPAFRKDGGGGSYGNCSYVLYL